MGPGDWFGEIGIVARSTHTATVSATSPLTVIAMTAFGFRRLEAEHPDIVGRSRASCPCASRVEALLSDKRSCPGWERSHGGIPASTPFKRTHLADPPSVHSALTGCVLLAAARANTGAADDRPRHSPPHEDAGPSG